jgi:Domain of Unknown Function with PDB structure (DUF3857)
MFQKTYYFIFIFIFFTLSLFSQPAKWGENFADDLKMTVYPEDTSAKAVVLQDVGSINFEDSQSKVGIIFRRHRRIKVFDKSAFDEGNLFVRYNSYENENALKLEVVLINPDGTKTKIKTDNIYTLKVNKYFTDKKIFIPNLQAGCIIEYRSELDIDNLSFLNGWSFQEDMPVRWSEINTYIPEFYNYVTLSNITFPVEVNETTQEKSTTRIFNEFFRCSHLRKAIKNVPALKNEPYVTTINDYRNKIQFQLKEISYPGQTVVPILEDWPKLAKLLNKHEEFGDCYNKSGKNKKLIEAAASILNNTTLTELDRLSQLLEFVTNNIKWNDDTDFFIDKGINDALKERSGNMSDINLGLVALCKEAGFEAYPMLFSSREHGYMTTEYPMVNQFNGVLAYVILKDKSVKILDGTSPYHGINMVAAQHYNGGGWVVREKEPMWVEINAPERVSIVTGGLELDEKGNLKGKMRFNLNGHEALEFRKKIADDKEGKFLKSEFLGKTNDYTIDSLVFENLKDYSKPLSVKFNISILNAGQVSNNLIYCPAMTTFFVKENPFKAISRFCPINFESTLKAQYIVTIKAPPAYKVEEMPTSLNLQLPNDAGKMVFSCSPNPSGETQVVMRLNIKQIDYSVEEYPNLQEFYGKIVEKTQDQIVFKKI